MRIDGFAFAIFGAALAAGLAAPTGAAADDRAGLLARSIALGYPATAEGEAACFGTLSASVIEAAPPGEGRADALSQAVAAVGHVCERVHARRGAMDQACALAAVIQGRLAPEVCDEVEARAAAWWHAMVEDRPEETALLLR